MKKTIKTLITLMLAVALGSLAHAQSASISVDATVISEIAVANVNNLNFGTLVAGQIKTIDLFGNVSVSTGSTLGTTSQGEFTVAAQAGADVTISLVLPTVLTGGGSSSLPIVFKETITDFDFSYTQSTIQVITQPGNGGFDINPDSPSERFISFPNFDIGGGVNGVRVFIGGVVNATNATAGTYTGTITLNATYN